MKLTRIDVVCGGMRRIVWWFTLLALMMLPAGRCASAQGVSTTTVQGTVYLANGQAGAGTLAVSWPSFTTAAGQSIAADSLTVTIPADGFVSVNLAPNQGATPAGEYYTATYYMSDGSTNTEYWVVPVAAQVTIAQVRSQLMPAVEAIQAVSKAYVDQSVAAVQQGQLTASGGTLTGPLILSADPTQPLMAADKHYVDTAAAVALPANGVTTSAGGNLAAPGSITAPDATSSSASDEMATVNNLHNAAARSVREFGVQGNGLYSDFEMTAGSNVVTLVDVSSPFNCATDVGKLISLPTVDSDHRTLYTTITGCTSGTQATVATNATYSFNGTGTYLNQAIWASDDAAAFNTAISWAGSQTTTRNQQIGLYIPCGIYGLSSQLSISVTLSIQGQSEGCAQMMYMGASSVDAAVEILPPSTTTPVLRQGYYLNAVNHPEITPTCSGSGCSPGLGGGGYVGGALSNLSVYGNKYSDWALSILGPTNFAAQNVATHGGSVGGFYTLNGVQNKWTQMVTEPDNTFGRGSCVAGQYFDGTAAGQGQVPTIIDSPNASGCTGTALTFNFAGATVVEGAQVSGNGQSLNVTATNSGITFLDNLFEGASAADVVAGEDNLFANDIFSGAGLTVTGTRNDFLKTIFGFSGTLAISGANNVFDAPTLSGTLTVTDTSKTSQWRGVSAYNQGAPLQNFPMDQDSTLPITGWNEPVSRAFGTWQTSAGLPVNIVTNDLTSGEAWKAIFIGTWLDTGTNTALPTYTELTDSSNVVTFSSGYTVTFSITSSGYFQMASSATGLGFTGEVVVMPKLGATSGGAGSDSAQFAGGVQAASFGVGVNTVLPSALTGYHGTSGTKVQLSDGTGTSGNLAEFNSNGSVAAGPAPPASAMVGISDTQTLTNKSIAGSEINSGTVGAAQMPAFSGDCTTTAGATALTCTKTSGTAFAASATSTTAGTGLNGAAAPASALFAGTNSGQQIVPATTANLASFLSTLTGCSTPNYFYSPASGNCQAGGGGGGGTYPASGYYGLSNGTGWATSHLDDGVTTPGDVSSSEPLQVVDTGGNAVIRSIDNVSATLVAQVDYPSASSPTAMPEIAVNACYSPSGINNCGLGNGGSLYGLQAGDGVSYAELPFSLGSEQQLYIAPSGASCPECVGVNTSTPDYTLDVFGPGAASGTIDAGGSGGGYKINGAAPSGHYLRGNGSLYVDSAIQAADVPGLTGSPTPGQFWGYNGSTQGWDTETVVLAANATTTSATFASLTLALPTLPASATAYGHCDLIYEASSTSDGVVLGLSTSAAASDFQIIGSTRYSTTSAVVNLLPPTTPTTTATTTAITASADVASSSAYYHVRVDFSLFTSTNPVTITVEGDIASGGTLTLVKGSVCSWQP